jgi:signal transduction histidine kinase
MENTFFPDTPHHLLLTHFAMGGSLMGSGILALACLYLWHLTPHQKALLYWALAFLTHLLGTGLTLFSLFFTDINSDGIQPLLLALMTYFIWRGNYAFSETETGFNPFFPLVFAALWGWTGQKTGVSLPLAQMPLFLVCSLVLAHTGLQFWKHDAQNPHVGHPLTGGLFLAFALHLAAYPLFRIWDSPLAIPIEYIISAILLFCIGLSLVLSSEREQRQAAERLSEALLEEALRRGEAETALQSLNRHLEAQIEERTQALQASQSERVRQEKLAALGALVAGLSHELNTPIGNSLTVASALQEDIRRFAQELEGNTPLRRSRLSQFIERNSEAADLLQRGLGRASELIQGFKQVAIDQTSQQRRHFALAVMMDELLITLRPMLKNRPIRLQVRIPPDLIMESYPGPLGQVLTNLLSNALMHAFPDELAESKTPQALPSIKIARIRISAYAIGSDRIELSFSDNGAGIPDEALSRIYDPFFTTRLGRGGSGLGLHIVHQIVTQQLGGRLDVRSQEGEGTTFTLLLPCKASESSEKPSDILPSHSSFL